MNTAGLDLFDAAEMQEECKPAADGLPGQLMAVLDVLRDRRGETVAIPAPDIATAAGILADGSRTARGSAVRHLLETHYDRLPWPVVAGARGYYRPDSAEEYRHYWNSLRSRAACILERAADFCASAIADGHGDDVPTPEDVRQVVRHLDSVHHA